MRLFELGQLQQAAPSFERVSRMLVLKSRLGGLATLQSALILDSLGQSKEAEKLYRRIQGHPVSEVARKAKQMLFGFQAQAFLKADTISYAARGWERGCVCAWWGKGGGKCVAEGVRFNAALGCACYIKLLTSFDGGYIHQESWSWVG